MCKHFFLIDDDEDELEIFVEALSKLNIHCKCTYAQSAEQALDMLNYLTPDVIFVDINMPRINGFECSRLIRHKKNHNDTYIVMYSSGVTETTINLAVANGANTCLRKTTSIADLVKAMEKMIGRSVETADAVSAHRQAL
jgi:DNA-binding response OmpR family regulator